jgi:peptide/nickel transport system substrate-binding protein
LPGNIVTLDGHNSRGTTHVFNVFDRLIALDEQLNWMPRLAESWDRDASMTRVTLRLRRDVHFHTGREFTSADVLWNFSRVKDPSVGGGTYATFVAPLNSVDASDRYTVVLTSHEPYPYIGHILQTLNLLDPESMELPDAVSRPVGTGPFKFIEFAQGDHLTLSRNADYWRPVLPSLDAIQIRMFQDPQNQIAALEGGALDVAINPPLHDSDRLKKDPRFRLVLNNNSGALYVFQANTTQYPTSNKYFRQALQYAIDRRRIAESVLLGLGEPSNLPWSPTSPAFDADRNRTYSFDLDRSQALLARAGVGDVELDLDYSTDSPEVATMAQIVQADLAKLGVRLILKPNDPAHLASLQYSTQYRGLAAGVALFGHSHPGALFGSPYYGPLNNWSGIKNDTHRAVAIAMSTEVDPVRAKQAYGAFSDYLLDESFTIGIATFTPRLLTSSRVRGLTYNTMYMPDPASAWLATSS